MTATINIPDISIMSPSELISHRNWGDEPIWKIIITYPSHLRRWFTNLRDAFHKYTCEGYSSQLFDTFHLRESFWLNFWSYLSQSGSLEASFLASGGIRACFSLEWCIFLLRRYFLKTNSIPKCSDKLYITIYYYSNKGIFQNRGIKNWVELRYESLNDLTPIGKEEQKLSSPEGLERVKDLVLNYYKLYNRLPTRQENGFKFIFKAAKRKTWIEFGIESWADLVYAIFNKALISGCWKGIKGLYRAQQAVNQYYTQTGDIPSGRSKINPNLAKAFKEGYWKEWGIFTWKDLCVSVFGDIQDCNSTSTYQEQSFLL